MILQLVDRGYEVWFANRRGNKYSNRNVRDGEWSLKERWAFNWADEGIYDWPAMVDYVLDVSGKPKVTMIGYSQGTSSAYYGLAKMQDYFAPRVHRFIAMASCIQRGLFYFEYEEQVKKFAKLEELGIYNFNGGDESSGSAAQICGTFS